MIELSIVGNRLTNLRGNTPQSEVCKSVGITQSALSSYENGKRMPRDSIKVQLAIYYGVSVESIFFNSNSTISGEKRGEEIK